MNDSVTQCANCGARLATPNMVCPHCEPEFLAPNTAQHTGKYRCPDCGCRFDQVGTGLWPPNVKWYRPQSYKLQCPHCQAFLRDRTIPYRSRAELTALPLLIIASAFSPWRPGTQIVLLALLMVVEFIRWRAVKKTVYVEEDRYLSDKPGAPM